MALRDEIVGMIEERKLYPNAVGEESDLYRDLGFDSLTFVGLLVDVEEALDITFGIAEMGGCVRVGQLIRIAEEKVMEAGLEHD